MKSTFVIYNVLVAGALVQPVMAQSTLEQWQKLMPNSGNALPKTLQEPVISQVQAISQVPKGYFVDPYDAEMHEATVAARGGQWSQAWKSFGHGLHSLFDPELNAARLERENEKNQR